MESENFYAFWWMPGQSGQAKLLPYNHRFYICLKVNKTAFTTPALVFCRSDNLPWDDADMGYVVSFDKSFFTKPTWCNFESIDLFKGDEPLIFMLDEEAVELFAPVFNNICNSIYSNYLYKYDLVRTYLFQIIHLTIKVHLQTVDIVKSPIRYVRLTKCGINMIVRIKLGHKQ